MRNNRPFLREPPYRRRETLIERLGFLFCSDFTFRLFIPNWSCRFVGNSNRGRVNYRPDIKSPAIGFKQAGQAAGKERPLARVVSASAIACTRGKPQRSIRRPSLDSASHWLGAERDWSEDTPPFIIYEYILRTLFLLYTSIYS